MANPTQDQSSNPKPGRTSNRGFASMDPQRQREIASQGGRAAHQKGTAHEFDSAEAREAGRKGGQAVSRDRRHMAEIGQRGGQSSGGNRSRLRQQQQQQDQGQSQQGGSNEPMQNQ